MANEAELRLHRCCFTGHRPEKLKESPEEVKAWLEERIDRAIAGGIVTFISGCGMGVDIWAGQIVLRKKTANPKIHLIAAVPWPGFSSRWSDEWRQQYEELLETADLVVNVCRQYHDGVFRQRNEWMVDHSNRMIAFYNGEPGGTREMIAYAERKGIEVITNNPVYEGRPKRERKAKEEQSHILPFPENIARDIGLSGIFGEDRYEELTDDQIAGLEHVLCMLPERERELLEYRYRERKTFEECAERFEMSRQRAQQIASKVLRKLRHPTRIAFIRDGFHKAELMLMLRCAEEIKNILVVQQRRRPLMNEEDVVKLVFQGMLGVGHLVPSEEEAKKRLHLEMSGLEPNADELLTEGVSPQWFRLNLRAAKAKDMKEAEIAHMLCESAKRRPLSFTRRNVYNFCVKLDGSDRMEAAARRVLDESWLPSHSEEYRAAYHPAYRVLHNDFRRV